MSVWTKKKVNPDWSEWSLKYGFPVEMVIKGKAKDN